MTDSFSPSTLAERIKKGDRRALSRTITLAESHREDHRTQAEEILHCLASSHPTKTQRKTQRIGISGAPGVGKSTFIEALGLQALEHHHHHHHHHRVAVLAVDPSSTTGGGAILGDKTRMAELTRHDHAYIRPSPSGLSSGGIARGTGAAIALCEAAGFDFIIVETVGVGQAETAVYEVTDCFCLLINPSGGDALQGVKRGIMEIADIIIVNKADGSLEQNALQTAREYASALSLIRPAHAEWQPKLLTISALHKKNISDVITTIEQFFAKRSAAIHPHRIQQRQKTFQKEFQDALTRYVIREASFKKALPLMEQEVEQGTKTPHQAARWLVENFFEKKT